MLSNTLLPPPILLLLLTTTIDGATAFAFPNSPRQCRPGGIPSAMTTTRTATSRDDGEAGRLVVESLVASLNSRTDPEVVVGSFFTRDVEYTDAGSFYARIAGGGALTRHLRLHAGSSSGLSSLGPHDARTIVIDDVVAGPTAACVLYHLEEQDAALPDTTSIAFYELTRDDDGGDMRIARAFDVSEPPSPKPGDAGLRLLRYASRFLDVIGGKGTRAVGDLEERGKEEGTTEPRSGDDSVSKYFDAWNRRDVAYASSLFADDCIMRDLQYDEPFVGRERFKGHLTRVAECLPGTFKFVVDDLVVDDRRAGAVWHVENDGSPLPFTRGCSFYSLDVETGIIRSGFEIPERAPPKTGLLRTLASKFLAEPIRLVPASLWVAYMYVLFVSDGILPGANALALEQRTWEEVRDLSINFFLVSPALHLPFSPVVHPMLEGVFNLLLAWAAMFAGFLSDERDDKPNLLPLGPMLVGMQFLTSGFLLPYLFTRTSERNSEEGATSVVYREDIAGDLQREVAEWRPLGLFLGGVGTSSILWGLFARPEFGEFGDRYASFLDLLSIDRVGSSFIVDLAIFAAFQGWFVDDDLWRRRVASDELAFLRNAAKLIPFFGLVTYLTLRPPLPTRGKKD
ncbi:hypothetical protein ACHAW5_006425 [Stephanodiscus triporus]|uniref:SnoaL-like domain-containing protein n=1 Tax=Stephanodiscus triporus TaxID=2934178 RepID=A0ABD3NY14_9STRA